MGGLKADVAWLEEMRIQDMEARNVERQKAYQR